MTTEHIGPAADDGDRPVVGACLRICDLRPEVEPLTGSIRRDLWGLGLSAADEAALECALRIADAWSGRVVAVAVGPPTIEPVLRQVSALGVSVVRAAATDPDTDSERAYEVDLGGDEQDLARTILAAFEPWGAPSLVVCGDRSADRGTGALPGFLAHQLEAAQALGLVSLEPEATTVGAGRALVAERRLDGGWREQLRVPLPAVCSVEGAGVRLRRASLAGALAAEESAVPVERSGSRSVGDADHARLPVQVGGSRAYRPRARVLPPPQSDDPRIRLLALTGALVAHDPPTVIGPVGAAGAADELIGFLVRHGYLDRPPDSDPGRVGAVGTEDDR